MLLYGYGGFLSALMPAFRLSTFHWIERGGIFAMPNLRDGSKYGEEWHRNGMLHKKQNVFEDFIGAEFLIKDGYTLARKFAALIREHSRGGPALLRIEKKAGLGGADMLKAAVEKGADEMTFALSQFDP